MDKRQNNKLIEQAIDFFENPERYSEEERSLLFMDENFLATYKDLLDCKFAVIRENSQKSTIPDKEWMSFTKKHISDSQKHKKNRLWISIAASFALIFSSYFFYENIVNDFSSEIIVFEANNQPQNSEVMLSTASGKRFILNQEDFIGENTIIHNNELVYSSKGKIKEEIHIITIPAGKDYKVILSDGSIVWLTANSRLEYPSVFTREERIVTLTGEAYFKVCPNKEKPFIIKTPTTITKVLGTELNIKSNSPTDSHVTLINGKIEIKSQKMDKFISIKQGEDAYLLNDGSFSVKKIDPDAYIYWKDGYFYFDKVSLNDIMTRIGQWYNVNIIFKNTKAMNYEMRYIGKRDMGLEHVLLLFNRMKKANITYKDDTVYIE